MGKVIVVDKTIKQSILDIGEQLLAPGEINLGWDDIKSVLLEGEKTLVAIGHGAGQNRTLKACQDALSCNGIIEARAISGILVHLTGPENLLLREVNEAIDTIKKVVCSSVELTFGVARDNSLKDEIRIVVIITQGYER